ncbi:MAG: ECF transporter S component [Clostridia bacterium]|nr:ECF transporter S component [Clostridia bacterium]
MQKKSPLYRMIVIAVLLALGMVLPFLTGQIPTIGQAISPLHIPAFIAGLTCGWGWGMALGLVLPILRSFVFGMPPLVAVAIPMAFELAAYAIVCGVLYPLLRGRMKRLPAMLAALIIAMVAGRIVGGAAKAIVMGITGSGFTFSMFISSYFVTTAVGALIHLIVVPVVVLALEKAHLSPNA